MNVLFDINHPAHFHLFKNTIKELRENGAKTLITVQNTASFAGPGLCFLRL